MKKSLLPAALLTLCLPVLASANALNCPSNNDILNDNYQKIGQATLTSTGKMMVYINQIQSDDGSEAVFLSAQLPVNDNGIQDIFCNYKLSKDGQDGTTFQMVYDMNGYIYKPYGGSWVQEPSSSAYTVCQSDNAPQSCTFTEENS